MAEHMHQWATPSIGRMKDAQDALDSWRAIVGPVADRDYIDAYLHELAIEEYEKMPDEPPG